MATNQAKYETKKRHVLLCAGARAQNYKNAHQRESIEMSGESQQLRPFLKEGFSLRKELAHYFYSREASRGIENNTSKLGDFL